MPFDVFISHSLKDKVTAEAVCAKLEAAKVRCWIAPRDIRPGADWAESIIAALGTCKVMVLVFSSHADASPQVKREVQRAFERGLTVVPFRIENVNPSASLEYYIGSVHWLDALTHPMEHHIDQLVSLVKAVTDAATQTEGPVPASTAAPKPLPATLAAHFPENQSIPEQQPDEEEPEAAPEQPHQEIINAGGDRAAITAAPRRSTGLLFTALAIIAAAAAGWWFGVGGHPRHQAEISQQAAPAPSSVPAKQDLADAKAQAAQANIQQQQEEESKKRAEQQAAIANATKENPWENSLGMKFVPVPGTQVLFSVWDTRVADFRAYVQDLGGQQKGGIYVMKVVKTENGGYTTKFELDKDASWEEPGFSQGRDHPVVGVSWNEAKAFCDWLTKKEQASGVIGPDQFYRLPTDDEWSAAVGSGKYPWGDEWPPPPGSGNYFDDALLATLPGKGWPQVPGNDGYAYTSPVGTFSENFYGLYDMGGNVWQWCEDWYRANMNETAVLEKLPFLKNDGGGQEYRVVRGGSWIDNVPEAMLSSCRVAGDSTSRTVNYGFRCVLAGGSSR